MNTLLQDLRYALRTLGRTPLFTVVAVGCLALGIGVNTTVYSIVYGLLYRPFPFAQPERLVVLEETQTRSGVADAPVSYANLRDWRAGARSFTSVGAVSARPLTLSGVEGAERVSGAAASWELFPTLGVRPALGRGFSAEDDRPGAAPVVVVGHSLWERRFGGAAGAVGRTLVVDGVAHTVVGVMPRGFGWPRNQEAWVPLAPRAHDAARTERQLFVTARLRDGVTVEQARAEMGGVARQLAERFPAENGGWGVRVASLRDELVGDGGSTIFLAMLGAVSFVLLIACANVANLMLARTVGRSREIALRAALGAGRGRIALQLLTESALLSLAAAVVGSALAVAGVSLFVGTVPAENALPTWVRFQVDGPVLLYTLCVAFATGLIFGVAPALRASRVELQTTLREGGRGQAGVSRGRLAGALVTVQVALSLTLLVGASLSLRSIANLLDAPAGFDTAPLMTFDLALPEESYAGEEERARRAEELATVVAALPGVRGVGVSPATPLVGGMEFANVEVEGRPFPRDQDPGVDFAGVTGGWLGTLDVPVVRGRALTDAEARGRSGGAMVNAAMATRLWPDADPLGRRFRLPGGEWLTVVGVVRDFRNASIRPAPVGPAAYLPLLYTPSRDLGMIVRVARGTDPAAVVPAVRAAVARVDPTIPVHRARTMEELRRLGFWGYRLVGGLFVVFGAVALLLAAVGVYGVIAYGVAQRTREMGVRSALGAQRSALIRLVVERGARMVLPGVALGLLATWGLSGALRSALYGVPSTDAASFAGGALFLAAVALLACYLPARRASRVDPMVALRSE
ncbi:MAG TPA: ABC transporter permease [Longimicrobium sp.]|jgi:predicted permease